MRSALHIPPSRNNWPGFQFFAMFEENECDFNIFWKWVSLAGKKTIYRLNPSNFMHSDAGGSQLFFLEQGLPFENKILFMHKNPEIVWDG